MLEAEPATHRPEVFDVPRLNLHAHTFFSYNPFGYSPTRFAWEAYRHGFAFAGIVDFDVLDGVDEFHAAGRQLGLKTCASIETRVYVPELEKHEINSPAEPGVAYHMGVGFVSQTLPKPTRAFLARLRSGAEERTRALVERVNEYLEPVCLDYDLDVVPLTPAGNATERHVCRAFVRKAAAHFEPAALRAFWFEKIGGYPDQQDALEALLRSKTMKKGGFAYLAPSPQTFPLLSDMDAFSRACGAIPTLAWLDGTSAAEQRMASWLDTARQSGTCAINIIPARNFTPGRHDQKLENLYAVVELANARHMPILAGTELNSPGQQLFNDLSVKELSPLAPAFLRGAAIVYGHTVLQRRGLGYLSPWALAHFPEPADRNAFFLAVGRRAAPRAEPPPCDDTWTPGAIFDHLSGARS